LLGVGRQLPSTVCVLDWTGSAVVGAEARQEAARQGIASFQIITGSQTIS
jgi:hypothetical protein